MWKLLIGTEKAVCSQYISNNNYANVLEKSQSILAFLLLSFSGQNHPLEHAILIMGSKESPHYS